MDADDESQKHALETMPTEPTSLGALAIDTNALAPRTSSTRDSEPDEIALPAPRVPLGAKVLFGLVVGGCVIVLGLCADAVRSDRAAQRFREAAARAALAPVEVGPVPPPPPATTTRDVPAPPAAASTATVRLAKKAHALKVDGKIVKGESVEVSCGAHLVAVDKAKPRRVDAVCGRTLVVDATKATLLRVEEERKGKGRS
jgi:hypothetical protein